MARGKSSQISTFLDKESTDLKLNYGIFFLLLMTLSTITLYLQFINYASLGYLKDPATHPVDSDIFTAVFACFNYSTLFSSNDFCSCRFNLGGLRLLRNDILRPVPNAAPFRRRT